MTTFSRPAKLIAKLFCVVALWLLWIPAQLTAQEDTRLLRNPAISDDHIAFVYANDIWLADHNGQNVQRLTTFQGSETDPHFSPDGKWLAFSGQYDGNTDVYLISVEGGEPQRLTWHPGPDLVRSWTNDGSAVMFASGRVRVPNPMPDQFWTVPVKGGIPTQFSVPRVNQGKVSPDGKHFAYEMILPWEEEFRLYRGGQANPIRVIDLETFEVEKINWNGSNDRHPIWAGDEVFFLSDRDLAMNIWSWNPTSKAVKQRTFFRDFDVKSLEYGGGKIIFDQGGYLFTMTPEGKPEQLHIQIDADFPWYRPHWESVSNNIQNAQLSPTGKRALFSARGDIFTVPAKKGDVRNLTQSAGAADRSPVWSPDGASISWFSDESGEYQLVIADQMGKVKKRITLPSPTWFYSPAWSPDSKKISFTDTDRVLWIVDVESGSTTKVDNEGFAHPQRTIYPEWSPDSRWIAYTRRLESEYNAIFVYSLDQEKTFQLTDGMSDSQAPAWDKSGKYLYFLASTNYGLNVGWLDMSSIRRPLERAIYMAVLSADEASPLAPESDEEEVKEEKAEVEEENEDEEKAKDEGKKVEIDFEGIDQRIIALGVPVRSYQALEAGAEGTIFYAETRPNQPGSTLHKYSLKDRKATELGGGVFQFRLSADGKKLLYAKGQSSVFIADAGGDKLNGEALNLSDMRMLVDPSAEWKQIFKEAWRYQRDYFYVENVHGLDLDWAYKTYAPWVAHARHRSDMNWLLDIFSGETSIGHSFVGGGDFPDVDFVPVGLLGADYEVENGRYKISKIYVGENWNPNLRAPLSGPGIKVNEGDYLLAVNGQELTADINIFSLFDHTAGKQTTLTLSSTPNMQDTREQMVVPVNSEFALRQREWMEGNRRLVDELSDGKLAYVWLPNTGQGGYVNFNRYYFAQKHKKGAIIDERFNGGGFAADYIVDLLARDLMGYFNNPVGDKQPFTSPGAGLFGPKVMVINEMAGSGGDYLPYMFSKKGIGPLVGTKTWGGLVGIWDVPPLIDGGGITAPRGGFFNTDGEWDVENIGVSPDVMVEQEPKLVRDGHDPQLEAAVKLALELLEKEEVKLKAQPADPVRVGRPGNK